MVDAWLGFAKTGDPSCPSVGTWPGYDERDRATMNFGAQTYVEKAPFETERALWAELL